MCVTLTIKGKSSVFSHLVILVTKLNWLYSHTTWLSSIVDPSTWLASHIASCGIYTYRQPSWKYELPRSILTATPWVRSSYLCFTLEGTEIERGGNLPWVTQGLSGGLGHTHTSGLQSQACNRSASPDHGPGLLWRTVTWWLWNWQDWYLVLFTQRSALVLDVSVSPLHPSWYTVS